MKKRSVLFCVFFFILWTGYGQDAIFSQFNAATLYLNPAMAAVEPMAILSLNARQQWRGLDQPYETNQLSLIVPVVTGGAHVGGFGGSVFQDKAGAGVKTTGMYLSGGYKLKLHPQQSLSFGVQAGYMTKTLDLESYKWNSQYNDQIGWDESVAPDVNDLNTTLGMLDISAGVYYYHFLQEGGYVDGRGLYAGLAAYHLNEPSNSMVEGSDSKLERLYKFHGGVGLYLKENIVLTPNTLVARQGEFTQINFGASAEYILSADQMGLVPSSFYAGAWHRLNDSFIFSLGLGNDVYRFDFSYDMNTSTLSQKFNGVTSTYEISLHLRKPPKGAQVVNHLPRYKIDH